MEIPLQLFRKNVVASLNFSTTRVSPLAQDHYIDLITEAAEKEDDGVRQSHTIVYGSRSIRPDHEAAG